LISQSLLSSQPLSPLFDPQNKWSLCELAGRQGENPIFYEFRPQVSLTQRVKAGPNANPKPP
jgi:hypothetical protein